MEKELLDIPEDLKKQAKLDQQIPEIVNDVLQTIEGIREYRGERKDDKYLEFNFDRILYWMIKSISHWTGHFTVGTRKNPYIEKIYHVLFSEIHQLIIELENNKHIKVKEYKFIKTVKYNGTLYRYISATFDNKKQKRKKTKIEYNDIYTHWTKNTGSNYLMQHLYYPAVLLTANTKDNFGIDLVGLEKIGVEFDLWKYGLVKGDEQEVVFPCSKQFIVEEKVIK